ncbi:MAG: VanZ family protein [Peptococcaceae bacterium BRH_c8a]|nr:MAG: VanZ family protein [Peptococcaceae bacterium BRH_c8a]
MIKFISWAAVFLWMALIFNLSAQVAEQSNQLSTGITEVIVKTLAQFAPGADFDIEGFNHIVRKNAHFFAYLMLGILVIYALRKSGVYGYRSVVIALGVCVLYAVSDEVHQLFVPGRGGQVQDVIIDSAGVSVGIGLYWVISRLVNIQVGDGS